MPNGHDKNLYRLSAACGDYRGRFGEWPTEAQLPPPIYDNLRSLLTPEDLADLNTRLRITSSGDDDSPISVSGAAGSVTYHGSRGWELAEEARRWFGVTARPGTA